MDGLVTACHDVSDGGLAVALAEMALASGASGIGFGLAITKRIVDHHGGTIALRETLGGGCEFEVTLARWWPEDGSPSDEARTLPVEPTVAPASW